MVFEFLSHALTVAIGAVYPTFETFKVIRDRDGTQMMRWLKYWTVFSSFLAAEAAGDALLLSYVIPGFTLLKLGFLVWAVNPWTNGSETIFNKIVAPMLAEYENDFDSLLSRIVTSAQEIIGNVRNGVLDRVRNCVFAVAFRGPAQIAEPLDFLQPQPRAVIRAVEEQDEDDVMGNYDPRVIVEPLQGGDHVVDLIRDEENIDEPGPALRTRRSTRRRKAISVGEPEAAPPRGRKGRPRKSTSRTRRTRAMQWSDEEME